MRSIEHLGLAYRVILAVTVVLGGLLVPSRTAAREGTDATDLPDAAANAYLVQPGDTLPAIASRFGVSTDRLMRQNGIRHPRDLYPGQQLDLSASVGVPMTRYRLSGGDEFLTLSQGSGLSPSRLAAANRLLRPTGLVVGEVLWLPSGLAFSVVHESGSDVGSKTAPRVEAALRTGAHLWDVYRLNRLPHAEGRVLLTPREPVGGSDANVCSSVGLPAPLTDLVLDPQPVDRGETAIVRLSTAAPVRCGARVLDRDLDCVPAANDRLTQMVFLAIPSMIPSGEITVTLKLTPDGGELVDVPLALRVGPGRYDYERIDLPPDRQSLLDPALSQFERETISRMRAVRTETRMWEYPFVRPVESAITSYFGSRRSYGYGFGSYHAGSDFDGVGGEPVVAPASGTVIMAERLVVRGNAILIDHGWGVISGFWHLSEFGVEVGQRVTQGDQVGSLGNTGLSTGAHLHWELWVNGEAVNALSWLAPDGPASLAGPVR